VKHPNSGTRYASRSPLNETQWPRGQWETIQATILSRIGAGLEGASVYGRTQSPQIRVFRHFAKLS
jgi:hypothetical protein